VFSRSVHRAGYLYIYRPCPRLEVSQAADLSLPMSPHRVPPPFPQPFASTGTANPAHNAAGTLEQRSIGSTQGSAYHSPGNTPNLIPPPTIPPRHPSAHIPANQPIQVSVRTHPAFPNASSTGPPCAYYYPVIPAVTRGAEERNYALARSSLQYPGCTRALCEQLFTSAFHVALAITAWLRGVGGGAFCSPCPEKSCVCPLQPNIYVF
jgi:hypothetical protein